MAVFAADQTGMEGHPCLPGKGNKELLGQLGVKGTHGAHSHGHIVVGLPSTGDVHRGHDQGLVHGKQAIPKPANARLVPQGLSKGLTKDDAAVLHRVMGVHLQVSPAGERQVKAAMPGKGHQHVVEKAHARGHFRGTCAIQVQRQGDIGLFGGSGNGGGPHYYSFTIWASAAITRSFSSGVPTVIRRQSSRPGVLLKSRTRIEQQSRSWHHT